MKWSRAAGAAMVIVAVVGATVQAVTIGFGVGYDVSGLILVNALSELPIAPALDVRAQVGFATPGVAGLMLITFDLLGHWVLPPFDPYVGVGIGTALTPPPYSTGLLLEAVGGVRVESFNVVQLFLEGRYLVRRTDVGWSAGPVFEGGLLVRF